MDPAAGFRIVRAIAAAYGRLLRGLAVIAGIMMAAIVVMIVFDVTVRNLGFQPPPHTLALTEYGLLYITMLSAPWLVRTRGHVYIEMVTAAVPPRVRAIMAKIVYAICLATSVVLFLYSAEVTLINYQRQVMDIRSFDMPRWVLFASMPVGFLLMGIEFGRYLFGRATMYTGEAGIHE